ncbi:DUF6612 family protein [Sporosarcina sp. FSL W7-1283]|uniref:DUF6612 family protein n=1 Tax=Sporosarcina sp. FSL W7-1283 TaxID=2921560 RepID=UPI0030F6B5F6
MKSISRLLMLVLSAIVLSACAESADNLTMQEVQTRLDQSPEELKSYEIDMALTVLAKDMAKGEQKQVNKGKIQYVDKESPDFHASYVTTTDGQLNDTKAEVYKKAEVVLANENGGRWEDVSGQYTEEELLNVQYEKVIDRLGEVKEELAMKEKDNEYIFTYDGNDQDFYKVFQELFNMSFKGVDSSNIASKLEVKIAKDHMRLKEFHYEAEGKNPTQSVTISVDLNYGKVNEAEEIMLPEVE